MNKTLVNILLLFFHSMLFGHGRQWHIYDDMPMPVAGAEVVCHNNKIYIFGGYQEKDSPPISTIQVFDPAKGPGERWAIAGDMLIPRSNFIARLYDDTVYIAGGQTGQNKEIVTFMEKWSFGNNGTDAKFEDDLVLNRVGSTGEIWKDFFIIIGGYNNIKPEYGSGYIAAYHLGLKRRVGPFLASAGQEPYNQTSVLLGNVIYIFGGIRSGVSNRVYRIDLDALDWELGPPIPPEGPWRIHPDLPFPRSSMEAVIWDSTSVWLIGGHSEDEKALNAVSEFVVTPNGYEHLPKPRLNKARKELAAAKMDTVIYVFGGLNEYDEVLNSVEILHDSVNSVGVQNKENNVATFKLKQNYPNPFNAATTIEFELAEPQWIQLDIYSANGQFVRSLVEAKLTPGTHRYVWDGAGMDGNSMPSGLYLYKIITEQEIQTRKMLLVK